jgi:hypothetical protein
LHIKENEEVKKIIERMDKVGGIKALNNKSSNEERANIKFT